MPKQSKDITGRRFSSLTVIKRSETKTQSGRELWECLCKCGRTKLFRAFNLESGKTHSCGCETHSRAVTSRFKGVGGLGKSYWGALLRSAKRRGIAVSLTISQAWELYEKQNGVCALSGEALKFTDNYAAFNGTASLDRIDSSNGYSIDNVQWVHKDVNNMKQDLSEDRFKALCKKIAEKN